MIKHLLLCLTLGLMANACNRDSKTNSGTATATPAPPADLTTDGDGITEKTTFIDPVSGSPVEGERPVQALSTAIAPEPTTTKDTKVPTPVEPQPKTPQESRVVRVLTTNYWIVTALIKINDKPANRQNQGAWFKFHPDGSYEYGYFENKIGTGAWTFDGKSAILSMDSALLGDDREWSIKIGSDEDIMIWVGTERYLTTGTQARLQNYLFIPKNRKEIGLPD
ncbi:MAG: hypothetical protein H6577_14115 [Lewinellaceae bacterium]|nr:hypothetical protein [Saprospiraceae bacterium]MCB9339263.1 hypothetical protein [Lewinellaceae bacterium]